MCYWLFLGNKISIAAVIAIYKDYQGSKQYTVILFAYCWCENVKCISVLLLLIKKRVLLIVRRLSAKMMTILGRKFTFPKYITLCPPFPLSHSKLSNNSKSSFGCWRSLRRWIRLGIDTWSDHGFTANQVVSCLGQLQVIVGAIEFVLFVYSLANSLGSTVSQTPWGSGKILRCKKSDWKPTLGRILMIRAAGVADRESREGVRAAPNWKGGWTVIASDVICCPSYPYTQLRRRYTVSPES